MVKYMHVVLVAVDPGYELGVHYEHFKTSSIVATTEMTSQASSCHESATTFNCCARELLSVSDMHHANSR